MRINKYLAKSGLGSRRFCEKLITENQIRINGEICDDLSYQVTNNDIVTYDGKTVNPSEEFEYYMFNKPIGVVTSMKDELGRKDIEFYLAKNDIKSRVYPVGRLDYDSKGLIILTNDGDLTYKATHPKFKVEKIYIVVINEKLGKEDILKLEKGINLEEGITSKCSIRVMNSKVSNNMSNKERMTLKMTIKQGWNRQIRRMFEAVDRKVIYLKRIGMGNIKLDKLLQEGNIKKISINDIEKLKKCFF